MLGIEQRTDHIVFRIAEAGILEAQAPGQGAEDIDIGFGLTGGRQRRTGQLQVIVTVSKIKIGMFEESGRGQDDIGVIGGIVLELFENYGEQIGPPGRGGPHF